MELTLASLSRYNYRLSAPRLPVQQRHVQTGWPAYPAATAIPRWPRRRKVARVLRQIDFGVCVGHFDLLNKIEFRQAMSPAADNA